MCGQRTDARYDRLHTSWNCGSWGVVGLPKRTLKGSGIRRNQPFVERFSLFCEALRMNGLYPYRDCLKIS